MPSKVAVVKRDNGCQQAFRRALQLIGGIGDLDADDRDVTIKIGVYDPRALNHPSLDVTKAVVNGLPRVRRVYLAESDNRVAGALGRLQIWDDVFTERVLPFNLSEDSDVRTAIIAGEKVRLSHILYTPYVRVSLHAFRGLRGAGQTLYGSILKNLLGVIPDVRKDRFHEKLSVALVDILEAIGGLDLAVLDATHTYHGRFEEAKPMNRTKTDLLIVGRDAIAVDAVGFSLLGINPLEVRTMAEATKRGLGQADLSQIKVMGEPPSKMGILVP